MIFGIAATKSAVVIAETKGTGNKFAIIAIRSIPFEVQSGDHLAELLRCLTTIFGRGARGASLTIALLKCSSGRFGSCLEAIKAEARHHRHLHRGQHQTAPGGPPTRARARDQKWRDRAAELFNPDGKRQNWSKGAAGAVAVAFTVAVD